MKKKCTALIAAVLMIGLLSACGKADGRYVYVSQINADDYVTLGEYIGVEVHETAPFVPDGYVSQYIDTYILEPRTELTPVDDRTDVREGDTVNIDYSGYRDGVAFDRGTAQGQDLTIGSGKFIPGFEDGLIGKNVGETVSLDLTFPSNYDNAEMAGAEVTFEVTINSISISDTPELTDELVKELGLEGCGTVDELNTYLYDYFYSAAESAYNNTLKNDIAQTVLAGCTFKKDLPEKMIDRYYDVLIEDMTQTAASYNMDLTAYIKEYYYMDEADYKEVVRNNAKTMAQQYVMFKAVADEQNIKVTDEEIAQKMEEWAADFGYESVEMIKEEMDEESINEYIMAETVVNFLIENAKIYTDEEN